MKYCVVTLRINDGETEYYSSGAHELKKGESMAKLARNMAKNWYSDEECVKIRKDTYEFELLGVIVGVDKVVPCTEEEYGVLRKFI